MEKDLMIGSARTQRIAEMFGLETRQDNATLVRGPDWATAIAQAVQQVPLKPGTLTLIGGASGSGKSSLLRALRERHGERRWMDVNAIEVRQDAAVVDCFDSHALEQVLEVLGGVGLGEVWTYLRNPRQLSEGQQLRLKLALAIWQIRRARHSAILAADEFGAVLDRVTAKIVANCLRREIAKMKHVAVVVATAHGDLEAALLPKVVVRCDFGNFEVKQ